MRTQPNRRRNPASVPVSAELLEPRTLLTSPGRPVDEIPSIDGSGNNVENPDWGSADVELLRLADPGYADGKKEPAGADRPSAREISNTIVAADESTPNGRYLTDILWLWGQFIDHDLDLTEPVDPLEPMDVAVPQWDPFFDPFGTGAATIGLNRSIYGFDENGVRQQVNQITAFLDGSMVYGSDSVRAAALRTFEGGKLKTSDGDLLPFNTLGLPNAGGTSAELFLAGDVRANENVALSAMHTLWVREHNRIAEEIAADDPTLSDEDIYQRARALVRAELQVITYKEFLPALLGRHALPDYSGYDPTVNPGISSEFSTAAYRLGHSFLSSTLERLDENGNVIPDGHLTLREAFFKPSELQEHGVDSILRGLSKNLAEELDNQIVDDVRNFLFGPPGTGGFDLGSLNIQRGRDHGLASYNDTREALGLARWTDFNELSSVPEVVAKFASVYEDVDNIDLWVGGLAEDHLSGSSLGETFTAILVDQFERLRDGDRFWYQNVFRGQSLQELENTTLADVIERNTGIQGLQQNIFFAPSVLIVDLDEHHAMDVTVRATDETLLVINSHNRRVIASRPLDGVERVVLIGSNRRPETITIDSISADNLPGGIAVDAGTNPGDVLRIVGTNKDDQVLVNRDEVSINGLAVEFTGVDRIVVETLGGEDEVDVSDDVEIPVKRDGRGDHGHHHGPRHLGNLLETLFGSDDFLESLLGSKRRR